MHNKNVHIATYQDRAKEFEKTLPKFKKPVVVRLGGKLKYENYPIQINSVEAVKNSIDKTKQKQLLIKGGIKTLTVLKEPAYPCIIKGKVRSCGTFVKLIKNTKEFNEAAKVFNEKCQGYILEPYFKATSEYRLHCSNKEVFFAVKKVKYDEADIIVTSKNHHNVQEFLKPRLWKQIQAECIKAMNVLGLELACFDVIYSSAGDHSFTIVEANTNPEMLNHTYQAYEKQIIKLANEKIEKGDIHIPIKKGAEAPVRQEPKREQKVAVEEKLAPHVDFLHQLLELEPTKEVLIKALSKLPEDKLVDLLRRIK